MALTSVLIVDEDLDRTAAAEACLLPDHRLRVVGRARTILVAQEQIRLLHPDVVLLSRNAVSQPGAPDGLGLTRRLKADAPAPLVILLTSDESRAARQEAAAAGADALLLDFDLSTSLRPLIHLLHGEVPPRAVPAKRLRRMKAVASSGRR